MPLSGIESILFFFGLVCQPENFEHKSWWIDETTRRDAETEVPKYE